jgi:hypothetical protein
MKLNDLDEQQNRLISTQLKMRYCWSCYHLKGLNNGIFQCQHPINDDLKNESVDGLVWKYIVSNKLENYDSSDFGIGSYCSCYEINMDTAKKNLKKIKSLLATSR